MTEYREDDDPTQPPDPGDDATGGGTFKPTPQYTCGQICQGEEGTDQYETCISCVCSDTCSAEGSDLAGSNPPYTCVVLSGHVWTELGCITPTNNGIIVAVTRIFFGIVTTFAILQGIRGGLMINTDDPEKIKEGKGLFISAVTAMIFGALIPIILNFIGIDVLGLGELISL